MKVLETKKAFDEALEAAGEDTPVLVDFYADWCMPCRAISPLVEKLSEKYTGKMICVKVDVDKNNDTAAAANVTAMPTFQIYKNGNKVDELIGARKEKLLALFEKHGGPVPGGLDLDTVPVKLTEGTSCWMYLVAILLGLFVFITTALTVPRTTVPEFNPYYKPPVPYSQMTEYHLRTLPFEEVVQMFYHLPAPKKIEGEYSALLLDAGDLVNNFIGHLFTPLWPGAWVGKGFAGGKDGFGYNMFLRGGKYERRLPMETRFAQSVFDGKPIFELEYRRQRHLMGLSGMRDEVREVNPGLLLGLGTFGRTEQKRKEPFPFVLSGPHAPPAPDKLIGALVRGDGEAYDKTEL